MHWLKWLKGLANESVAVDHIHFEKYDNRKERRASGESFVYSIGNYD